MIYLTKNTKLINNRALVKDVADRIMALSKQEYYYNTGDYLFSDMQDAKVIDEKCRLKMCIWFFTMVDYFNFSHETARIAISYLDRFISSSEGSFIMYDRHAYKLASICSISLAVKVNESICTTLDTKLLVEIGRGNYSIEEISKMETKILSALEWRLCPPTPSTYLESLLDLLRFTSPLFYLPLLEKIRNLTCIQLDLATDYIFISVKPSYLALASLLNSIKEVEHVLPVKVRQEFLHTISLILGIDYSDEFIIHLRTELLELKGKISTLNGGDRNVMSCSRLTQNIVGKEDSNSPVCVNQALL